MGIQSRLHRATPARKRTGTRVIGRRGTEDEAAEEVINRATSNTDNQMCTLSCTNIPVGVESNKFYIAGTTAI